MEDDDARRLGAVIAGSYFTPAAVQAGRGGHRRPAHRLGDRAGGLAGWPARRSPTPRSGAESRITVAAIVRGDESIVAPEPDEVIRPGDQLVVMGRPEDLPAFLDQFIH